MPCSQLYKVVLAVVSFVALISTTLLICYTCTNPKCDQEKLVPSCSNVEVTTPPIIQTDMCVTCGDCHHQSSEPAIEYLHRPFSDMEPLNQLCTPTGRRCPEPAGNHSCCVHHMKKILQVISDHAGPKMFLMCGSVLGNARHSGYMIPWDDDIDFGMLGSHVPWFQKVMIPIFEEHGFVVARHAGQKPQSESLIKNPARGLDSADEMVEAPPYDYYNITVSSENHLHVDVAVLSCVGTEGETTFLVDAPLEWSKTNISDFQPAYRSWVMLAEEVVPPEPTKFLGIRLYWPCKPIEYLCRMYGSNWMVAFNRDDLVATKPYRWPSGLVGVDTEWNRPDFKAFVINMERDVERLHHAIHQFHEERLSWTVVHADKPPKEIIESISFGDVQEPHARSTFRRMSIPQKNVWYSHATAWMMVSEQLGPDEWGLVVEDDFALPHGTFSILKEIIDEVRVGQMLKECPDKVVIRLGRDWCDQRDRIQVFPWSTHLFQCPFSTGAWAYLLQPDTARFLLQTARDRSPMSWPVDHFFNPPPVDYTKTFVGKNFLKESSEIYAMYEADPGPDLKLRYKLQEQVNQRSPCGDCNRIQVIQELSTIMNASRSSGM